MAYSTEIPTQLLQFFSSELCLTRYTLPPYTYNDTPNKKLAKQEVISVVNLIHMSLQWI